MVPLRLRLNSLIERSKASLFLVPMVAVVFAIALATFAIDIDRRLDASGSDLPLVLTSTVESARALLGTVAGATISFAGIAFSVSLLIIQQAATQYSPRVVHTLFRDPFNKRVMALVVGTFTYCLLVLRSVRTALEEGGDPVIPNLSVALAVALGIITILAIVAFISHSAHSMDISNILHNVEESAITQIRREWPEPTNDSAPPPAPPRPDNPAHTIRFASSGWVQQLDLDRLADAVPTGETMWVETYPGRYAIRGAPICVLSAVPHDVEATERNVRDAVAMGETRTMQQDVSFGLRQLTDVALKALSPGINDPTTAQDAIFHSTSVLAELLRREPPALSSHLEQVVLMEQPDHDDLIRLAFDEVRQAAATSPRVCIYLLEALALLLQTSADDAVEQQQSLLRQAQLVVTGCATADNLTVDIASVEEAFAKRFEPAGARPDHHDRTTRR